MRFNLFRNRGAELSQRISDSKPVAQAALKQSRQWVEEIGTIPEQPFQTKTGLEITLTKLGGVVVSWSEDSQISEANFRQDYRPDFAAKAIDGTEIGFDKINEWTSDIARESSDGSVRYGAPLPLFPEAVQELVRRAVESQDQPKF